MVTALMDDVLAQFEAPMQSDDSRSERRQRAQILVAALDGDRERLFELRSLFLLRLHRASDDFGATEGLRVVESAIAMITQESVRSAR